MSECHGMHGPLNEIVQGHMLEHDRKCDRSVGLRDCTCGLERLRLIAVEELTALRAAAAERDALLDAMDPDTRALWIRHLCVMSDRDVLRSALEDAIRTWTFGEGQQPTHSWHDREDWFERNHVAREIRTAALARAQKQAEPG